MDAQVLAPQIRSAVRKATKTEGDPVYGLKVSVTQPRGSMVTGVDVVVHIDMAEVRHPADENGHTLWTARGKAIVARAYELAEPALVEADGRHSFCDITVAGVCAPAPDALPVHDEDQDDEDVYDAEVYDHSAAKEDARNAAAGMPVDDERPRCPNGHGPMQGRAEIHANGHAGGTWHTCVTPECGASYIAPSMLLIESFAETTGVHITPTGAAPADDVAYGARRGGLAAVR